MIFDIERGLLAFLVAKKLGFETRTVLKKRNEEDEFHSYMDFEFKDSEESEWKPIEKFSIPDLEIQMMKVKYKLE